MTEPSVPSVELPPPRPRLIRRLLDWVLLGALIGAVLGVLQSVEKIGDYGTRWTYDALIIGVYFAFLGARLGAVAGGSWIVARRYNLLAGILVGTLLGIAIHFVLRTVYPVFAFQIVRAPEPVLPAMRHAFEDALIEAPSVAYGSILLAAFFGCVSWFIGRILAAPPAQAQVTNIQAAEDKGLETSSGVEVPGDGCAQEHC